ncbi:MAG: MlaD family protein [Candidatus Egerieousia sp.]
MKLNRIQKIGFFVIAILIALFFAINFFQGYDIFHKSNMYYTTFKEVDGITATAPVYIRGFKVGSIESIKFNQKSDRFVVKMSVLREYAIPVDSKAEIYSSDIMGGKSLRIALGKASECADNGDTLTGGNVPDMLTTLYNSVGPLKEKAYALLDNLNEALENVNAVLDDNAKADLKGSMEKLRGTLANMEKLSSSLNGIVPDMKSSIGNFKEMTTELNSQDGDLKQTLANLNNTTRQLSDANLQETISELNKLLKQLGDPSTTTGKLMTTGELHDSLDSLVNSLDDLIRKIKENPKKYIRVSVF